MSFLDKVPEYIKTLDAEALTLEREVLEIDLGHDCDCEYCQRREEISEESQARSDEINKDIRARKRLVKKLKDFAELCSHREKATS